MKIPLKHILIYREDLLKEYSDARLKFLEKKKALDSVNNLLDENNIQNYEKFNGDYDLWEGLNINFPIPHIAPSVK